MSRTLDVKGLHCPEPVLRTQRVMRELPAGETLTVLATDPAAVMDFPYYCHQAGLELVSVTKEPGLLIFEIRKPPSAR
ncbi:MAG TPA: sulfurtransferase TusA family protein [Candidatus Acidoferrum sp.]|nr:sulfurtransferase TusA family protein [Candidatus Acidoferrum sp.]